MNARHALLLSRLLLPAVTLAVLAPRPALAGEVEAAEHRRLNQEMRKRAGTGAWTGVERAFQDLLELQDKGEVLTFEDWYLGAQAARALGDIAQSKERLTAALAVEENAEARAWLESIDVNYAAVDIRGSKKKDSAHELKVKAMPFAPDQRAAIEAAQATLVAQGSYEGLLPAGSYIFTSGECEQSFAVEAGVAQEVRCGGGAAPADVPAEPGLAFVGPRVDLGGAFTLGGAAIDGTYGQGGAWAPPEGFSGAGPRTLVGVELGLSMGLTAGAQVGYHSLFGAGNQLHLGVGQANVGYRLGKVWLSAGGVLGFVPKASVTSAVDERQFMQMCLDAGTAEVTCEVVASDPENLQDVTWQASGGLMPGAVATVSFALPVDVGGLKLAASVSGGSMFDPYRNYPWGALALTLAPAPK